MSYIKILDVLRSETSPSSKKSTHLVEFTVGSSKTKYKGIFTQYKSFLLPLKQVISNDIAENGLSFYNQN